MPGKLKVTGDTKVPNDPMLVKAYCEGRLAAKNGAASPSFGSAKTGVVANNNGLNWIAKKYGQGLTVSLIDPAANSAALRVVAGGSSINVFLATNGSGAITTTAAQVIAAVAANSTANALVTASNDGASTGAAAVTAQTVTLVGSTVNKPIGDASGQAYGAGHASWSANPAGVGRDACDLPYGGGYVAP